jgi:excisionase family DNA binding protein
MTMMQPVQAIDVADVEKLVDASVVAEALGVSTATIWRLARRGDLPCLTVGGRVRRFNLPAVLRALQSPHGAVSVPRLGIGPDIRA